MSSGDTTSVIKTSNLPSCGDAAAWTAGSKTADSIWLLGAAPSFELAELTEFKGDFLGCSSRGLFNTGAPGAPCRSGSGISVPLLPSSWCLVPSLRMNASASPVKKIQTIVNRWTFHYAVKISEYYSELTHCDITGHERNTTYKDK